MMPIELPDDLESLDYNTLAGFIQSLRWDIDMTKNAANPLKDQKSHITTAMTAVQDQMQKAVEEFKARLQDLMDKRQKVLDSMYAKDREIQLLEGDISKVQKALAKKREKENEALLLQQIEKEIEHLLAELDCWPKLREYQKDDIIYMIRAYKEGRNGVLNANEMGLGKTMEAALALYILDHLFSQDFGRKPRILWLTKKSLIVSSLREIQKWYPKPPLLPLLGSWPLAQREMVWDIASSSNAGLITNYESPKSTKILQEYAWDIVVVDEVQKLKGGANPSGPTDVWLTSKKIMEKARFMLMLSGTPMVNRPADVWAYFHLFDPIRFPKLNQFEEMFTINKYLDGEYKIVMDVDKLLAMIKGQVIRRRLDEVGIEMPERTIDDRWLVMEDEQRVAYDKMRDFFYLELDEDIAAGKSITATSILARLTRLWQINEWPPSIELKDEAGKFTGLKVNVPHSSKINDALDILDELLAAGEQVVITSRFNPPLEEIYDRINGFSDGKIKCEFFNAKTADDVGNIERRFQQKETDVILMNTQMAEGLNLHKSPEDWPGGASHMIMLDIWWNPAKNDQVMGRIYRPGANDHVIIHRLFNEESLDLFLLAINAEKAEKIDNVMESDELRPASEWREFLKGKI